MKLLALSVVLFAALTPMQTFASTDSEQGDVQVCIWGDVDASGLVNVNVQVCGNDIL